MLLLVKLSAHIKTIKHNRSCSIRDMWEEFSYSMCLHTLKPHWAYHHKKAACRIIFAGEHCHNCCWSFDCFRSTDSTYCLCVVYLQINLWYVLHCKFASLITYSREITPSQQFHTPVQYKHNLFLQALECNLNICSKSNIWQSSTQRSDLKWDHLTVERSNKIFFILNIESGINQQ